MENIRQMTIEDYDGVYNLWINTPGMGLNTVDDSREGIAKYLKRNPTTCFVAEDNGDVCRVDYLIVSKKHRCIGAGRALFSAYVDWCRKNEIKNAYLWPDGDTPEKIYIEGGYRLVEVRTAGRAVYNEGRPEKM